VTAESNETVSESLVSPEAPFVMVPPEDEISSQGPPLVVEVAALQPNWEPGAPVSVTFTVCVGDVDWSSETDPGLTCILASGVQRIVKVADGTESVSVCELAGLIVNA
jgi:hypothetical protein